jgi:hypothetical protein
MDTIDRRLQPAMPAMPPPAVEPTPSPPTPTRRSRLGWVALVLALAVVGAGVFAIMQTSSLSGASGDLEAARARSQRLAARVDVLEGRLDETKDELETATGDLEAAHAYGASCRTALMGVDRAFALIAQSSMAAMTGDRERAKSLAGQVKAELREIRDDYQACMSAAPTTDADAL